VHLLRFYIELVSFGGDLLCSGQPSVKIHAQVFHFILLGYIKIAHLHCRTGLIA
jgi:hypothetical protein